MVTTRDGRVETIDDGEAVAQAIKEMFKIWRGTWELMPFLGIDFFTSLFGALDTAILEQSIRQEGLKRTYITNVPRVSVDLERDRISNISLDVQSIDAGRVTVERAL